MAYSASNGDGGPSSPEESQSEDEQEVAQQGDRHRRRLHNAQFEAMSVLFLNCYAPRS